MCFGLAGVGSGGWGVFQSDWGLFLVIGLFA